MSRPDRKISLYYMYLSPLRTPDTENDRTYDKDYLIGVLDWLMRQPESFRVHCIPKQNRTMFLSSYRKLENDNICEIELVFSSGKYNHCPDYISASDGKRRTSTKRRDEAEEELTHILWQFGLNDNVMIFEERKSGVTISAVSRYLNDYITVFHMDSDTRQDYGLHIGIIQDGDFLEKLDELKQIGQCELDISTRLLGSEINNMLSDATIGNSTKYKQKLIFSADLRRHETILASFIRGLYAMHSEREEISRIKVSGKDNDSTPLFLDTDLLKKIRFVSVDLNENGTVNTESMFYSMKKLLRE